MGENRLFLGGGSDVIGCGMDEVARYVGSEEDFVELVSRLGSPVVDIVAISQLQVRGRPRGCYRIRLRDGRVFKYRRMPTAERAKIVEQLVGLLDSRSIPRVLDRCGAGLLIEYVDARPLQPDDATSEFLATAASLQGLIHRTDVSELLEKVPTPHPSERARQLRSNIDRLVGCGALMSREGDGLWDLASNHAPRVLDQGLVHNDYCSQNMLLTADGRLVIVDNETLGLGAQAFDLARTWYLWPMKLEDRAVYWGRYRRYRDPTQFRSSFLFWVIDAMVRSALFRLTAESADVLFPLDMLRLVLQSPEHETLGRHLI